MIHLDTERCNGCGLCVLVCKGGPLLLDKGKAEVSEQNAVLGCVACGHCAAVCPRDCIRLSGKGLLPDDLTALPRKEDRTGYEGLLSLLLSRRSARNFQEKEVPREIIEKILAAASTAPMGLPPSEVSVLVFSGREKVRSFRKELLASIRSARWMQSGLFLLFVRLFSGREAWRMYRDFVLPVMNLYIQKDREGTDWFFYDAPLAFYFYGSPSADPADPLIAATLAMTAGEALGLGSCFLGFPGHLIRHSRRLKVKYDLPGKLQPGIVLLFGYPAVRFHRSLKRRFAGVRYAE